MKKSKGFTLLEMIMVLIILSLVSIVAISNYTYSLKSTKMADLKSTVDSVRKALNFYYADNGFYPRQIWYMTEEGFNQGRSPKIYIDIPPPQFSPVNAWSGLSSIRKTITGYCCNYAWCYNFLTGEFTPGTAGLTPAERLDLDGVDICDY